MERAPPAVAKAIRVARHRRKVATGGSKRVEVTIPARDAPLIKAAAGVLRAGGDGANSVREALQSLASPPTARTGKDLVAFLRASPLAEVELEIERDRTTGRSIELG